VIVLFFFGVILILLIALKHFKERKYN